LRESAARLLALAEQMPADMAASDLAWEWVWHSLTDHAIEHVVVAASPGRGSAAPGMVPATRTIRYLSRADVEAAGVSMAEVIDAVEEGFADKGAGRVELPAKTAIHPGSPDSFIHAMPANIPAIGATGVKWISGFPENQDAGLPYINGLLLLNEPATGIPTAVMDATWITAMRTAAASAVSARRLARPDSERLAIVACGVQGMAHLEALPLVLPAIRHVAAFDPDEARAAALVEAARARGLEADVAATAADAVRDADVIVTSGPILHEPHATLGGGLVKPGAFVSAVDFDSYWHASALAELDLFTTDDIAQLEHFRSLGYFRSIPPIDADLGELVTGVHPGRTSPDQRTMACNLGVAIDDVAVAVVVLRAAERAGIGTLLAL
jgi:ornithine cyclodeaminase/alanine dehydrogenase